MRNGVRLGVVALAALLVAGQAAGQEVAGVAVDGASGDPLEGVVVTLRPAGSDTATFRAVTDRTGYFSVRTAGPGMHVLSAGRIGYHVAERPVDVGPAGTLTQVVIRMATEAVSLDGIEVTVRRRQALGADALNEFNRKRFLYGREGTGVGHFFDREALERIAPIEVTDVVRQVPGVWVRWEADVNRYQISLQSRSEARATGGCGEPAIYLNGRRVSPTGHLSVAAMGNTIELNQIINPGDLDGVEVYRRASDVPLEYNDQYSACGVIALWSRKYQGSATAEEARAAAERYRGPLFLAGGAAFVTTAGPPRVGVVRASARSGWLATLDLGYGLPWANGLELRLAGGAAIATGAVLMDADGNRHEVDGVMGLLRFDVAWPAVTLAERRLFLVAGAGGRSFTPPKRPLTCSGDACATAIYLTRTSRSPAGKLGLEYEIVPYEARLAAAYHVGEWFDRLQHDFSFGLKIPVRW